MSPRDDGPFGHNGYDGHADDHIQRLHRRSDRARDWGFYFNAIMFVVVMLGFLGTVIYGIIRAIILTLE